MAEKDQAEVSEEGQKTDYAFYEFPATDVTAAPLKIVYSLQLFHEIDFVVNEGYRKVSHGGIETAGLLFGSIGGSEIRIEAFRPIECEHLSGPSLHLSERDLAALEAQILATGSERDLASFQPIGWFLGHSRSSLELTDSEAAQFDRFFPEPFRLSVIVKPGRFQATCFGFLVRKHDGEMPRDASASAVILPLPGRSFKAGQLIASIPAPKLVPTGKRYERAHTAEELALPEQSDHKLPTSEPETPTATVDRAKDDEPATPAARPNRLERRKVAREKARLIEEAYPAPPPDSPASIPAPSQPQSEQSREVEVHRGPNPFFKPASMPSLPMDPVRFIPSAQDRFPEQLPEYDEHPISEKSVLNARSITALALAAFLGCVVGYLAYLQLPSPVIPMDVRPVDQTIIVSWPPEETRSATYAAVRINDGVPVPLSAQEKRLGHVALPAARDFKVEIVARNWIRDSRGIVRYLHATQTVVPSTLPPSP